jgi:N-acetylglutamate synthase-like GNAT family acetyltransferase
MIRRAKAGDIIKIAELIKIGSVTGQVLMRSEEEVAGAIHNFFVAREDHKIVGCCALDVYGKKLAEVRSLVVLPEYRKRGIGGKLIKRCLSEARDLGIYQVLAVTDRHKLFKTAGFKAKLNKKTPMFINLS